MYSIITGVNSVFCVENGHTIIHINKQINKCIAFDTDNGMAQMFAEVWRWDMCEYA